MAKVTEGDPYYYAPHRFNENGYCIYKRDDHKRMEPLCEQVNQSDASLIVDALNHYEWCDEEDINTKADREKWEATKDG